MRSSSRDRCGSAILALCIAIIILAAPAGALHAEYSILPDGKGYHAAIEIEDRDEFTFRGFGVFGEQIPLPVEEVEVSGENGTIPYTWQGRDRIAFPAGNYTVHYRGSIANNQFQATLDEPYAVTVLLPPGLDVRHLFLGWVSSGGSVTAEEDGSVSVYWERASYVEVRFYGPLRETLFNAFGSLWLVACFILLLPYLLGRGRG